MSYDNFYSFVFKGLLTDTALDKTGVRRSASSNFLLADITERLSLEILPPELVQKASQMAPVYTTIAAFENSARAFVSKVMQAKHGDSWWTNKVSQSIRTTAESRRKEEEKIKYHAQRGKDPINYSDFTDLSTIMTQNWADFQHIIPTQEWARNIFETLKKSRNVIMHSGELDKTDIERIGSYIRDWVKQVGT